MKAISKIPHSTPVRLAVEILLWHGERQILSYNTPHPGATAGTEARRSASRKPSALRFGRATLFQRASCKDKMLLVSIPSLLDRDPSLMDGYCAGHR